MSECVVRMEMPSSCEGCPMCGTASVGNGLYKLWCMCGDIPASSQRRPKDCPIICSLPEGHGRLIDADAAVNDLRDEIFECKMDGLKGTPMPTEHLGLMKNRIADDDICPTIVPAERSEE